MTTQLYMNLYDDVLRNIINCLNNQLIDEIEVKTDDFNFKIEEIIKALNVYIEHHYDSSDDKNYVNMLEFYKTFK